MHFKRYSRKYGQPINMSDIISSNDLLKLNEQKLPEKKELLKCVELALYQLDDMRKAEGEKILEDILKRVKRIQKIIGLIKKRRIALNLRNKTN